MPWNKADEKENKSNESSVREEARTPDSRKIAERPASLDGVNKEKP
ncbi:hypothetical protein [Paenibacillus humicola]|nr:hypothetical protein [Paenibacillus humicola]